MNRGLIMRAFRELWGMTLVLGLVLLGAEAALAYILPTFGAQMSGQMLQIAFVRSVLKAVLGTEIGDSLGPQMFQAIAWVHPVVLALAWAHGIIACTRVPAGEIDRGTADVLLGLPVSRWEVYVSETLVWLASGLAVIGAALAGNALGSLGLAPAGRPRPGPLLIVAANLFFLYFAVGGLAWLMSAMSDRRGRAITAVLVIVLALFLLNFLGQFWPPLERFVILSPLHYHRPVAVFSGGVCPWRDMLVLLGAGAVLWIAGGVVFSRRDICTV